MSTVVVHGQTELDAALADASVKTVLIDSPRGIWLRLLVDIDAGYVHQGNGAIVNARTGADVTDEVTLLVKAGWAYPSTLVHDWVGRPCYQLTWTGMQQREVVR